MNKKINYYNLYNLNPFPLKTKLSDKSDSITTINSWFFSFDHSMKLFHCYDINGDLLI